MENKKTHIPIIRNSKKTSFNTDSESDDFNPIQTDSTDASYFFNSDDAITFDFKNENNS